MNEETVIVLADNVPKKGIVVPIKVVSGDVNNVSEADGFQKWQVRGYAAEEYKASQV